jgi:threonine dehydrogenase-like Zn-dependent dehydrogenase
MKATRFYGDHGIRVEEVPEPAIEQPTDVLVRITLAGMCGSDLHLFHHGEALGLPVGMRTGHELLGTADAIRPGVERVRPGDRVLASMIYDGTYGTAGRGSTRPAPASVRPGSRP